MVKTGAANGTALRPSSARAKTRKLFLPEKYFKGLSRSARSRRVKEIARGVKLDWKDPAAYRPFKTDLEVPARAKKKSSYTAKWNKLYPNVKSLVDKSKLTGVPLANLNHVFRKGLAAWRTGHRPAATQGQWGHARVASYLLCGKAHYTSDAANVQRAKNKSVRARKWFKRCKNSIN